MSLADYHTCSLKKKPIKRPKHVHCLWLIQFCTVFLSYVMMRKCWETSPDDRPTFKELYTNANKCIERIAGYLEMGFNPFAGDGECVISAVEDKDDDVGVQSDNSDDHYKMT